MKETDLSVLVSRDISPFELGLATTGAATNWFEHDLSAAVGRESSSSRFSHGRTGPRQIPDDHGGKSRGSVVGSTLVVFFPSACITPFRFPLSSCFHKRGFIFCLRVLKYHG